MKQFLKKMFRALGLEVAKFDFTAENRARRLEYIYEKYKDFTMIPPAAYKDNLIVAEQASVIDGNVIECGVWRGGMSAGIAEILGRDKKYFLLDSFEGLPRAKEVDGADAINWQNDKDGSTYYENCAAEEEVAQKAMKLTNVSFITIKGWFNETLPEFKPEGPIALLRLDGDWYDSTMDCLKYLYPHVNNNGLIILDDYYAWQGCSRAVHDYLSSISSISRIYKSREGVAYIIKKDDYQG